MSDGTFFHIDQIPVTVFLTADSDNALLAMYPSDKAAMESRDAGLCIQFDTSEDAENWLSVNLQMVMHARRALILKQRASNKPENTDGDDQP